MHSEAFFTAKDRQSGDCMYDTTHVYACVVSSICVQCMSLGTRLFLPLQAANQQVAGTKDCSRPWAFDAIEVPYAYSNVSSHDCAVVLGGRRLCVYIAFALGDSF